VKSVVRLSDTVRISKNEKGIDRVDSDSRVSSHIRGSDLSVGDDLVDSGSDLVGVVVETIGKKWNS